ncbi:MAG: hypothetical protein COV48_04965 [Elusimicrobia bacterium CG11_big_fil_rev_8_21_14_0_20_64_6]|nr:MAG: hypothetical protein COV48_04965 [Elusimicrobia bacterium CG11_big_fil_rev_8_21_14_0_20_64_6]
MIAVIAQTKHDWNCPVSMVFEKGSEYLLFLNRTPSNYLFNVVTDVQGSIRAERSIIRTIKKFGEKQ